jgi:SAM-dependent methyltransferase
MMDILGRAISEYFYGGKEYKLWVHDNHGPKVEMIVPIYFRSPEAMPELELMAIDMCRGKTLDIGAGAGSHALLLQEKGIDVTAIDISEGAVGVMKERGVEKAFVQDVFEMKEEKFDTLLLLMNGIGLVQTIEGLNRFLQHARTLLKKGGNYFSILLTWLIYMKRGSLNCLITTARSSVVTNIAVKNRNGFLGCILMSKHFEKLLWTMVLILMFYLLMSQTNTLPCLPCRNSILYRSGIIPDGPAFLSL